MNETDRQLPPAWVKKVTHMLPFAPGGKQVTIKLKNRDVFKNVVISNSRTIIAVKSHKVMPFEIDEILDIYQSEEDKDLSNRKRFKAEANDWHFWGG